MAMHRPINSAKLRNINSLKGPGGLGLVPKRGSNPLPFEFFAQEIKQIHTSQQKEPTTNITTEPTLKQPLENNKPGAMKEEKSCHFQEESNTVTICLNNQQVFFF
jgi:hypothetical protein